MGKAHCRARWVSAYRAQSVHSDLLLVDDSHVVRTGGANESVAAAWTLIPDHAGSYKWVWSCEADILCPPDSLARLIEHAGLKEADMVAAFYPHRGQPGFIAALGCTLMTGDLASRIGTYVKDVWCSAESAALRLPTHRVTLDGLGLAHIDG